MAFATEDHPNAVRVREAIQSAVGGDLSKIDALLAPNAMQRAPGLNPLSGHYPAQEGFNVARVIAAYTNGNFQPINEFVIGTDQYVVVFNRIRAQRGPRSLDHVICSVWTFEGDKATEISDHFSPVEEFDQFWVPQDGD